MQNTYMMIKPEIVAADEQKIGEIIAIVQKAGFRIEKLELKQLSRETVEEFYVEHVERPFYGELVDYITSGPVVALQLKRDDAVIKMRELVGATNPNEAATGTIRDLYGTELSTNAVHASDSPESASRELGLVFG
ncbi:nucleoside-diphosphate kinase [bacterium]|jgi:nucleoside-diphosphate kinase|nr:nucleoside-diphosphate kinase [bacterium]